MKEKLIIKNFGSIKSVELELGRFNVLIGDQGTGKSTVAKVLSAIQSTILREIWTLGWEKQNLNIKTESFKEYLRKTGIESYLSVTSHIYFESDLMVFSYKDGNAEQKIIPNEKLNSTADYDFHYIPSERNFVIHFGKNLYAIIETGTQLPVLFTRFGTKFLAARESSLIFDYTNIIGIKYSFRHKDTDTIILQNGQEVLLSNVSTGIQATVPMLVVFDQIIKKSRLLKDDDFKKLLIIEEPELNCFPGTQFKLLKYLVENLITKDHFGKHHYKNQLLITTHSPYILTSLNNLMYAYKIGQAHNKEANKIINKKYWINPDDVSVYMMLPNGECEDIFDREEGLIKAEKIDSVTNTLNEQFSSLLNLEFAANEFNT